MRPIHPGGRQAHDPNDQLAPALPSTRAMARPGWLAIEFDDTGIGIEPAVLPRIFDAVRAGRTTTFEADPGDWGSGLAISRSLAEALGGRLSATSPGPGTARHFRLEAPHRVCRRMRRRPRCRTDRASGRPARPRAGWAFRFTHPSRRRQHGNAPVPDAVPRASRAHVVTADRVATARAAVDEAEVPFDLLLSDIELPDGDGLYLMRDWRPRPVAPESR